MTNSQKILVVDDDPELRQLLASYLNKHGFDTLLAAGALKFDIILLKNTSKSKL
jgi:DNA-binding response OmpR family regulator